MPVLQTKRETTTYKLPKTGASVEMYDYPLAGELVGGLSITAAEQEIDTLKIFSSLISSWDLTDENNNPLDPNVANLSLLPMEDFLVISEVVSRITKDLNNNPVKKNL